MVKIGFVIFAALALCGSLICCGPSSVELAEHADDIPSSDYASFQTSVLMKLAHHAPAEKVKPIAKLPIQSYWRIRTGGHMQILPKVERTREYILFSADNGTNLFVLLSMPMGSFLKPFVPNKKLVCLKPDGTVLWQSRSMEVQASEKRVPVPEGILLTWSNGASSVLISNTGKVTNYPSPPTRAIKDFSSRSYEWLSEGDHYRYDWTRFKGRQTTLASVKEWIDEGRCNWFTADYAYAATYGPWSQDKDQVVTEINLATGVTTSTTIFKWNGNSKAYITRPKRRVLGIFDHYVVWAEEIGSGLRIHKTPLNKNEKSRSLDVDEDPRSELQLTIDGKIFFRNDNKPIPPTPDRWNEWLFLANIVRMDLKPDPQDTGIQKLWIGHPKRVLGNGQIFSLD